MRLDFVRSRLIGGRPQPLLLRRIFALCGIIRFQILNRASNTNNQLMLTGIACRCCGE